MPARDGAAAAGKGVRWSVRCARRRRFSNRPRRTSVERRRRSSPVGETFVVQMTTPFLPSARKRRYEVSRIKEASLVNPAPKHLPRKVTHWLRYTTYGIWRAWGVVLGEVGIQSCTYSRSRAPRSHVFNVCHPISPCRGAHTPLAGKLWTPAWRRPFSLRLSSRIRGQLLRKWLPCLIFCPLRVPRTGYPCLYPRSANLSVGGDVDALQACPPLCIQSLGLLSLQNGKTKRVGGAAADARHQRGGAAADARHQSDAFPQWRRSRSPREPGHSALSTTARAIAMVMWNAASSITSFTPSKRWCALWAAGSRSLVACLVPTGLPHSP